MASESQWVDTPAGQLEVRLALPAGERATALVLCVHGKLSNPAEVWEWSCVTEPLRQRKVAQVIPNLHSCEKTSPAANWPTSDEALFEALDAVVAWALSLCDGGASTPVLIYGKSWGGAQALQLGARWSGPGSAIQLAGICLACPAAPQERAAAVAALSVPVLLAWAKDDQTIPFAQSEELLRELRGREQGATIFVPVDEGGHSVDRMAEVSPGLAAKLAEWPDLVLAPLAPGGILAGAAAKPSAPAAAAAREAGAP